MAHHHNRRSIDEQEALNGGRRRCRRAGADPGVASADCTGHIYNCPGYQYQCVKLFLGHAPSVFTNSDATEDSYEDSVYVTATGVRVHWYRCDGD